MAKRHLRNRQFLQLELEATSVQSFRRSPILRPFLLCVCKLDRQILKEYASKSHLGCVIFNQNVLLICLDQVTFLILRYLDLGLYSYYKPIFLNSENENE